MQVIRVDSIHPLDVILCCTNDGPGQSISAQTGGPYSHAALAMSLTSRFEATTSGITFSPVMICWAGFEGATVACYEDVSSYSVFHVWRHPELVTVSAARLRELQQQALDLAALYNCSEYPSPEAFLEYIESRRGEIGDRRTDRLCQWIRKKAATHPRVVPGVSCADLIARILVGLGLPLQTPQRDAELIFPNDLAVAGLERLPIVPIPAPITAIPDPATCALVNRSSSALRSTLSTYSARQRLYRDVSLFRNEFNGNTAGLGIDTTSAEAVAYLQDLRVAEIKAIDNIRTRDIRALRSVLEAEQKLTVTLSSIATCHANCSKCNRPSECHQFECAEPEDVQQVSDTAATVLRPLAEFVESHFEDPTDFEKLLHFLDHGTEGQREFLSGRPFGALLGDRQYRDIWCAGQSIEDARAELMELKQSGFLRQVGSGANVMFQRTDRPRRRTT